MALVAYIGIGNILIARQYDKDSEKWDDVEIQGLDVYLVKDGDFKILGTFESGDFVVEDSSKPEFVNRYRNLFLTPPSGARHNYDVTRYTPRNTMGW